MTAERWEDAPWLHVYAQSAWHEDAYIVGNREGLRRLYEMLAAALENRSSSSDTFFANDGEGYRLYAHVVEDPVLWRKLAVPYTDELAKENRRGDELCGCS